MNQINSKNKLTRRRDDKIRNATTLNKYLYLASCNKYILESFENSLEAS